MPSFDVFGGCVSRDLFEKLTKPGDLSKYFARSSLVSQFSTPFNMSSSSFNLESNFQKKMVLSDLNCLFLKHLEKNDVADFIVFDFLVERFKIYRIDNSVYTYSNEYKRSGLKLKGKYIQREEHLDLFEQSVLKIKPYLLKYKKVFLNKFFHAKSYKSIDGQICQFDNLDYIENENKFLEKIYEIFEKNIDNLIIVDGSGFMASETHKWGLTTYHFEDDFYKNVNKKISIFLDGSE